mmetsp:Transcript_25926/g.43216  ORF Transcript_25926/g.43216 Transcript_25926/m.43216 type:complete len:481 (+) Transcript_25926:93-1535(+)|eukprot:CAMPEP_0119014980 /NCGR_PEP_ID=MMETSP1176-20130426/10492_1 /TAXON_ID=265551 /ORGANISM="Synedropsis recta cf, Strain CCMP1620" /LENGTH=480 /DNA_ID=CAMNT_0006968235 /DNA_START=64 /DNA_END=1506 /DNA_ORIENTATION=-
MSSVTAAAAKTGVADVLEERLIDAEYKIWKKNTPYLYDFVMTHSLEWPSLTCQWLPTVKNAGEKASEHSLLLGTHTTGEQNYLMLASVNLPKNDAVIDNRGSGGSGSGSGSEQQPKESTTKAAASNSTTPAPQYDEEKKELGGFGHSAAASVGKIDIRLKVKHEGEVNRARYMPQNHFVVATRGPSPEIYIWDLTKHPSIPDDSSPFCPQGVCVGHSAEGYGMAWSPHVYGHLATGGEDCTIHLWDVNEAIGPKSATGTQIKPLSVFTGHSKVVEDIDWHHRDPNMIGSVSDDRSLLIWDTREKNPSKPVHSVANAHDADINCLSFNPISEFVLATGSADKTVAVWDIRNLKSRVQTLVGHTDQVYALEWAPFNESVLASSSADRRVAIWDLSRIGMEQSEEDAEDGPPELLFLHGGHTSKVSDFSWNAKDEWTIASVSEDNVLQVWNMAEEIYAGEEEVDESDGAGEDQLLGEDELEED